MNTLNVRISTPTEVVFEGNALSVSSKNSQGPFDILPSHANFITLIENWPIKIYLPSKKSLTFTFPLAIVYNRENKVSIYTDIQLNR